MNVEQARNAEMEADTAYRRIESLRAEAIEAARQRVIDEWRERLSAASDVRREARMARIAAEDAQPDHEWEGRRVFRMEPQGRSYQRLPDKRIEGIVETYRSTSDVPMSTPSYRLPAIGEAIVRLLKKDGTPGAKFEKLDRGCWSSKWQLVEDQP